MKKSLIENHIYNAHKFSFLYCIDWVWQTEQFSVCIKSMYQSIFCSTPWKSSIANAYVNSTMQF